MSRALLLACLLVLGAALPAFAHRIGIPVTTIEYNAASRTWEIMHRMSVHDFDKAMEDAAHSSRLYTSKEGLAEIHAYVSGHFNITGKGADMRFIGAELDRDMVWVYFELSGQASIVEIDDDLLMGTGQKTSHALVNIAGKDGVTSLIFQKNDRPKRVRLIKPDN